MYDARVWPLSRDLTTASFIPTLMHAPHVGTFTSASGVHVHRGDALPDGHGGSVFVMESAQNLVQRQAMRPEGVTLSSRPARDGAEFLATTDTWFRPVFAADSPDGALYIVDMYRKDIDHPAYVPEASRRLFDFTAGKERGRIYRVAAQHNGPTRTPVSLATDSNETLVEHLAHANGWWRDAAQRLLVERHAVAAVPLLRALASAGSAQGRLHALWTLDALDAIGDEDIRRALRDGSAGVRENALRIAERRLPQSTGLVNDVIGAAADVDPRVRLHVALALGATPDPRRLDALAALARLDGADRWTRAAVLSSVRDETSAFLDAFLEAPAATPAVRAAVMQDLGQLFGAAESPERCLAFVAAVSDPGGELSWQPAALSGVAAGLRARGLAAGTRSALMTLVSGETARSGNASDTARSGNALHRQAAEWLAIQMARAAELALLDAAPAAQRLPAIDLLGHGDWERVGATLVQLLDPARPAPVQLAAVRALGQMRAPEAALALLDRARWLAYTPRVRDAVLTTMLADERTTGVLVDALARGDVPAAALGASRWRRLTTHRSPAIREQAEKLYTATDTASAMQVYERLQTSVLARAGEPLRGAGAYATFCAACHTFDGAGGHVGPDLSGIRNQPADALLLHIVVPDYEITPGYESYTVETRDGQTILGRLESDAPNSLTLRDGAGDLRTILRTNIESMSTSTSSLMPVGLGQAMSPQDLADLLAYLKSGGVRRSDKQQ